MRKFSLWGKHHVTPARIIIALSNILLIWIAYFLGNQISVSGVEISSLWLYVLMLTFFIACFLYPKQRTSTTYIKRKMCDAVIISCSFFMVICLVMQLNRPSHLLQTTQAAVPADPSLYKSPEAQKLLEQFTSGQKKEFTAREKRIIRREFKYQLGQYAKAKLTGDKATGDKVGLIILACILAVGLMFLLLGLACSISCGGADGLAVVVAVLGTAGIIWGLIAVIHAIKKKKV